MSKTELEIQQLVSKAKNGDKWAFEQIIKELEQELRRLSRTYYIKGSEPEDTYQEACIGVLKAVQDWKEDGGTKFKHFAINICCKRHIITAIATAGRKYNDPLNNAISLDVPFATNSDDNEQYLIDFIPNNDPLTLDQYISQEEYESKSTDIRDRLTKLENKIFDEYMKGQTYQEIANVLNIKTKAVDNALMRIRKKASGLYNFGKEKREMLDQ
jgi:RNA polymerase sporulation-specific sigma factor